MNSYRGGKSLRGRSQRESFHEEAGEPIVVQIVRASGDGEFVGVCEDAFVM